MKCYTLLSLLLLSFSFVACNSNKNTNSTEESTVPTTSFKIAFGSCAHEDKPQGILDSVLTHEPDLFIYLGDNIYGDTEDMVELQAKYDKLAAKAPFQRLVDRTAILATWDDHDYGANDAGKYYPKKVASKEIFLNFWKEPLDSERRKHAGIYHAKEFKIGQQILQVILLDTRTFRSNLTHLKDTLTYKNDYEPSQSSDSTFLGAAQWTWLEKQFLKPADIRIIASSNQFSHEYNGWESWNNVPLERQKMLALIEQTKANGVVFISGDVHWGELSKIPATDIRYPIYDVTSSGLTQTWKDTEPNRNRVGAVVRETNFGMIELECHKSWSMNMQLFDNSNKIRVEKKVVADDLRFK